MKSFILTLFLFLPALGHVSQPDSNQLKPVLADLQLLQMAGLPALYTDPLTGVAYTVLTADMEQKLSEAAHAQRRCGGFEALPEGTDYLAQAKSAIADLQRIQIQHQLYSVPIGISKPIIENPAITQAINQLSADGIRSWVSWLSGFETRYNKGQEPNLHVYEFAKKLEEMKLKTTTPFTVDLIQHRSTLQKSVRVRFVGKSRPEEVIVLGAHLDSINGWGGGGKAPGADDNASGSSSLIEAFTVLMSQPQTDRTIEFYWYAGEESGLLGSAEIAEAAKQEKRNIIAVLQLDMTMFPGNGVNNITSINDFTSPWLRDYLERINATYIKATISNDKCGYGCSDHASWHRRGFPAVMPTEARFNDMFSMLHTEKDVISSVMSFEHSLVFSKIALVMALELGNSTEREVLQ